MGFRFRRSIKIAPGVRMNVGKKSASLSFGGKGARYTVSSTGKRTATVGIPGTGLYYTESSSSSKNKSSSNRNLSSPNHNYSDPYSEVEEFNNAIKYITSLHKDCDYSYDWEEINNRPSPLISDGKGVNEIEAENKLNNYNPGLLARVLKFLQTSELKKLEENILTARDKDLKIYEDWKKLNELSTLILQGDLDAYSYLIKDIEFSSSLGRSHLRTSDSTSIVIDFYIDIDNFIPKSYKVLTSTGRLSIKKYSKTDYYFIIQQYVSSLAIRIARNIFGLLPVHNAVVNIQADSLDTQTGNIVTNTILSVVVDEITLQSLILDSIVPFDALNNFEHNVKFLKTKGFQPVEKTM